MSDLDNIEKLEDLPRFERFHDYSWENDKYWGRGMPWKRLCSWFKSRVGHHIDDVIHDFIKLPWLLEEYKNLERVADYIELHTYRQGGEIFYFSKYNLRNLNPFGVRIKDSYRETLYVNPETKIVEIFTPPKKENYHVKRQKELAKKLRILGDYHQLYKQNGIWYEVIAEPITIKGFISYTLQKKGPKDILLEKTDSYSSNYSSNPYVKIVKKRQLNSKELRKHGIKND